MVRLTINLPDELHRAFKEAAIRRGRPMADLVAESLRFCGIKSTESARDLVVKARAASGLEEDAAQELAVGETRLLRHRESSPESQTRGEDL